MAAREVAVGALWKESAVVSASKVRSEWPGRVQSEGAGKPQVPVVWGVETAVCAPGILYELYFIPLHEPSVELTPGRN